jgi:predicted permease
VNSFLQDARYGIRMLMKAPGFTVVAVLTLALGIGANTAIFSVVNSLLLHPAGVAHPERVVAVRARYEKLNLKSIVISAPDFKLLHSDDGIFDAAAMEDGADFNYAGGAVPEHLRGAKVSSQWFDVFEARPLLGRVFTPEEDHPGAEHEVVLAYSTWKSVFGGDVGIVDRTVLLNQQSYKVIGVMGPEFEWPNPVDLWVPLALPPDAFADDNIFNEAHFAVARLKTGVPFSQAAAFMTVITRRVANDPRSGYPKSSGWGMFVVPFTQFVYGDVHAPLLILLAAVAFVLLIACANVAGLLLARATGRAREFAVRTALGAAPWRLARQLLTESVVLAIAGMALGFVVGSLGIQALLSLAPGNLSGGISVTIDGHVLLFTLAVAVASALIFGAGPAWQISRMDPQRNLSQGRGSASGSRGHHGIRDVLVVGQLALALVLLAGAGVFLKSLSKLQDVNVGFRPQGLTTAALSLPVHQYDTPAKQIAFVRTTLERLGNAPGVKSAAAGMPIPFSGFGGSASFEIEGRPRLPGDPGPHGDVREVSSAYFETMGIPLLRGRTFAESDREGTQPVVMIDENLAKLYWPNIDPVGKHMKINDKDPWATIIGVVAHVRHSQVVGEESSSEGTEGSGKGVYYFPLNQLPMYPQDASSVFLAARSNSNPAAVTNEIREAVRSVDPNQPISDVKTMEQRIALSLGPRRSAVALLSVFSIAAIVLAAIGLFGLVRYSVAQRTQEIGIRMALGAQPGDVMGMILLEGGKVALAGIAIGAGLAIVLMHIVKTLLYGVSAADPLTFFGVALLLAFVTMAACYFPARRAMRVDPLVALRYE